MGVLKQWLPYVLSGISAGGQYALIAVGYTMVYGILRLINFAHGDIFMVAGLIMVYLSATMPLYAALPAVVILTVALGFAVERCAYKPLRQAPRMSVMISAIGVSYLLQNLAYYVTGGVPKQYPELPWISDTITILGAYVLDICSFSHRRTYGNPVDAFRDMFNEKFDCGHAFSNQRNIPFDCSAEIWISLIFRK